jgi:divalent metal cation (Fe/Co/Zn/Cd) transporter
MGMASFEVIKESISALIFHTDFAIQPHLSSVYAMMAIVVIKMLLLWLCHVGAYKRPQRRSVYHYNHPTNSKTTTTAEATTTPMVDEEDVSSIAADAAGTGAAPAVGSAKQPQPPTTADTVAMQQQWADPTMEALAQDHWNDTLSNGVAALALALAVHDKRLWFLDPIGAMLISFYIIYSWYMTGREQIEHLTGKSAPGHFIGELVDLANEFDDRIVVDTVRAYHFGPKFLVEIEIVMDQSTLLYESHDLGMDLQYAIEGREEVERCFVHIDYQVRPYDEHVVSKVPELREKYIKGASSRTFRSTQSV